MYHYMGYCPMVIVRGLFFGGYCPGGHCARVIVRGLLTRS